MAISLDAHRRFFAEWLAASAGACDRRMAQAFFDVRREDYLGPGPWQVAAGTAYIQTRSADPRWLYQDILIGLDVDARINNGQPSLHARCLAALNVAPGDTVVHAGAGTGYYTAVLAYLTGPHGRVLALEIDERLAQRARANLLDLGNVEVRCASAVATDLPRCDAMYVNAGVTDLPGSWLDALKPGGRLMLPLTTQDGVGVMLHIVRTSCDGYRARALQSVGFTRCIGADSEGVSRALEQALDSIPWQRIRSLRRSGAPDRNAWCVGSGWWLSTAAEDAAVQDRA